MRARPDPTDPERALFRWRRWWITYGYGPRHRAGPYLTRATAAHAARSIWRGKAEPPFLVIEREP